MDVQRATKDYEAWLSTQVRLVDAGLKKKHEQMAKGPFRFLRATFYIWAKRWPQVCADLAKAPELLGVGDLHVENFGTWRDVEGRLIWGVNDFDEAHPVPYTHDLVRLATSAILAAAEGDLVIKDGDACEAIQEGYSEGLKSGGYPFVLAGKHEWLRELAVGETRDAAAFWNKLQRLPPFHGEVSPEAVRTIEELLPEPGLAYERRARITGLGSLGIPRMVAIGQWRGGYFAREAKALAPSAVAWTIGGGEVNYYPEVLERAVRAPDPSVQIAGSWVVRRLSPDCSRIALENLPRKRDEARLLAAMGHETANVHLGSRDAVRAVANDLRARPHGWLRDAARRMAETVAADADAWRSVNKTG